MESKNISPGAPGSLFPRFLEEAGVVKDLELLEKLHASSKAYAPVITGLPSVQNLSAVISLKEFSFDEGALDVVIDIFEEVRNKNEPLSPLAQYLAGDFQRILSYITGFISGKVVSFAMSAWGSAPQKLKELMTIQLKALFTSLASTRDDLETEIEHISKGAFHLIDSFLMHSDNRHEYIEFLKILGKYMSGKVEREVMHKALVDVLEVLKKDLLGMTHLVEAAQKVSEIALPQLTPLEQ